jgi:biopolymer transport protein ExbB/TolQ
MTDTASPSAAARRQTDSSSTVSGFFAAASPWFWGGVMTWGFYQAIPLLPVYSALAHRYFCGHEITYAEAGLFFVGMAILFGKLLSLGAEKRATRLVLPEVGGDVEEWCGAVERSLAGWPARMHHTWFARRLHDLTQFLAQRKSAEGIDAHARRLSDEASDDHYNSFALLQTITWAIPILGFLGTVIGITMAIANLTPEQLDKSLNTVTNGLGVAFDTTAQALALSMILVFSYLFVKRAEQQVLARIDDRITHEVIARLPLQSALPHPLLEAETHAAQDLIARTESLIAKQTALWQESVEGLRQRWTRTLDTQQEQLAHVLTDGMQHSLKDHAGLLKSLRQEFVTAYQLITEEAAQQIELARVRQAEQQQQVQAALTETWQHIRHELSAERTARTQEAEKWFGEFGRHVRYASQRFEEAARASQDQMAALSRQTELLAQVVAQEEHLAGLQTRLTENLEAVRAAEGFEETLHSLNAAIHLMTARARPQAA